MSQAIYVAVRHFDFWWGAYGLCPATSWEDLIFYEKEGDSYTWIGSLCACSRTHLEKIQPPGSLQPALSEAIQRFLQGNEVLFHRPQYEDPEGEGPPADSSKGQREGSPSGYLEIWYPGAGIDLEAVEICARAYCKKFLGRTIDEVHMKDRPALEEIEGQYAENLTLVTNERVNVVFADELVASLAKEWKVPKEEALAILRRSI